MFKVNDLMVYGSTGVCRVEAIGVPAGLPDGMGPHQYYTLRPLHDTGVIYAPVDSNIFMRPVVTREEAENLISGIPEIRAEECASSSPQLLSEHYRTFFASHNCEDLLQLIKTVYTKTHRSLSAGRQMGRTDQRYLQRAEQLLYEEFSVALGIPLDEVKPYIERRMHELEAAARGRSKTDQA